MESLARSASGYRGRLAPSPTGWLHLGHARTFWMAQERARRQEGVLILRVEDLDRGRCKPVYQAGLIEDLRWFGFRWQEGPDCGGPAGPYCQSERMAYYQAALLRLREGGYVYPCTCSRQDVLRAVRAPHAGEDEPIYPGTCRSRPAGGMRRGADGTAGAAPRFNWRFRVPDGETVAFVDENFGPQSFVAGKDFGDFVVWRQDGVPAYQLAVVVDDVAMGVTEVVRGEDLLKSTARQLLLYRALREAPPRFYHCPLVTDEVGVRLAKRHDSLSLRALRAAGRSPGELRRGWDAA